MPSNMTFSRTRTGCFTCREDGYKCDEQKPHCGRCVRLQKTCKGYGVKLKWRNFEGPLTTAQPGARRRTSKSKSPPGSDGGLAVTRPQTLRGPWDPVMIARNPSYLSPDVGTTDQYLLDHWTNSLATVVSMATGPKNPFLVHLTPMMMHSTALRSAVCSMAASHLAILRGDHALQTSAIHHRVLAVSSLRQTLQVQDPELSLATILLMQVSDRLFAIDTRADHLAGAKAIITGRGKDYAWDTPSAAFLLSLCFYHDVLASVSRGSSPLLGFDDGNDDEHRFSVDTMAMEGIASMQGLTAVVRLVGRISRMRGQSLDEQTTAGHAIAEALNALGGESDTEANDGAGAEIQDSNGTDSDIHHTVQAYKHAAFIYLYRVWCNVGAPHPLTLRHAGRCLAHLGRVQLSSALLSAHVWPLWTAGCETIDAEQRRAVGRRVDAMYEVRHLPSLRRIRQDIEEVWSIKDHRRTSTGVDNVDCIKAILRSRQREADLA